MKLKKKNPIGGGRCFGHAMEYIRNVPRGTFEKFFKRLNIEKGILPDNIPEVSKKLGIHLKSINSKIKYEELPFGRYLVVYKINNELHAGVIDSTEDEIKIWDWGVGDLSRYPIKYLWKVIYTNKLTF